MLNNVKTAFLKQSIRYKMPRSSRKHITYFYLNWGFKYLFLLNNSKVKMLSFLNWGQQEPETQEGSLGRDLIMIKRFLTQKPSDCWHLKKKEL